VLELAFRPDPRRPEPVYRQLEAYLRGLIRSGRVVAGEKLPATRELAEQLALSRNTVSHAYQALLDDGILTARVGQGTFVAARAAGAARGGDAEGAEARGERGFAWEGLLSQRAHALPVPPRLAAPRRPGDVRFDFLGGRIDPSLLPVTELRRTWSRAAGEVRQLANPVDPFGWPPLREEIALSLVARGIACEPEDVLVVSGAQQALDLLARVLVDPGDVVAMEQPGYFGAAAAFRTAGAQLVGVGVDVEGLRTDALARLLRSRRVKLVYATPSAQVPTGAVLSERRREALLALADEHQTPIVEDDYDRELRFDAAPLPALRTRDRGTRVVYVGTFSKALFPGLRVGYVVAPAPLRARLALARFYADFGTDALAQVAVAELLRSGALDRHVRRLRRAYGRRRDAMLAALAEAMPPGTRWTEPRGGHAVWVTFPASLDADALAVAAGRAGIAYAPGDHFRFDGGDRHCAALSFVNQDEETIRRGIALLGRLAAEHSDPRLGSGEERWEESA
jgi:DNA-binding transcriptional MocR family regulator